MKTPVTYYGGKQAIIGHILKLTPYHEVYTECFLGGGSYFWAKDPVSNETINDRLDIVVNFYRQLKRNYKALKVLIDESLFARQIHTQALAIVKGNLPADDLYKAWAFWFTCNFSHSCKIGGGMKYSNDSFTCCPQQLINKKEEFTELLVNRIEHTHIESKDALWVLRSRNVVNGFHYQDPPYLGCDQGHYKGYTVDNLCSLLEFNATECKGKFVLSHYNHPLIDEYIEKYGWKKQTIVHRLRATRKSGPDKVEILVYNFEEPATQQNLFH
jgi:DNA adenine methylase